MTTVRLKIELYANPLKMTTQGLHELKKLIDYLPDNAESLIFVLPNGEEKTVNRIGNHPIMISVGIMLGECGILGRGDSIVTFDINTENPTRIKIADIKPLINNDMEEVFEAGDDIDLSKFETEVYNADGGLHTFEYNGLYGIANEAGIVMIPPRFSDVILLGDGDMYYAEVFEGKKSLRHGILNKDADFVVQPKYQSCDTDAFFGMVKVNTGYPETGDVLYGLVDPCDKGREVLPCVAEEIDDCDDSWLLDPTFKERIRVKIGGKWGYLDQFGSLAIPPRFDEAQPFDGRWASVAIGDRKFQINRDGARLVQTDSNDSETAKTNNV